jgi:uncharacterized surface protein with fasciclin (FAS1) repeats
VSFTASWHALDSTRLYSPLWFNHISISQGDKGERSLQPASGTIITFVENEPTLSTLESAVARAGLSEVLAGTGPFTLFAPNDDGFAGAPARLLNTLANDEFLPHLRDSLAYHKLNAQVLAPDLLDNSIVRTLNDERIIVTLPPIAINGNSIVSADNIQSNGVVHIIDGLLGPSWVFNTLTDRYGNVRQGQR